MCLNIFSFLNVLVKKHKRSWCAETHGNVLSSRLIVCVFPLNVVGVCPSDHVTSHTHTHVLSFFCKLYSAVPLCTIPSEVLAVIIQISVGQEYNMENILLILGQKKMYKTLKSVRFICNLRFCWTKW